MRPVLEVTFQRKKLQPVVTGSETIFCDSVQQVKGSVSPDQTRGADTSPGNEEDFDEYEEDEDEDEEDDFPEEPATRNEAPAVLIDKSLMQVPQAGQVSVAVLLRYRS